MTEIASDIMLDAEAAPRAINPFDYFPARRSGIGGLGGTESFSDPSYAFHTHYQPCTPGPLTFKVTLHNLVATYGTLVLRVNVIPIDLRFDPKLAKTAPVPLASLAEVGGEVSIEIKAKEGMLYAILGHVYEETDATASDITITVQQAANHDLAAGDLEGNAETRFHPPEAGGAVHLLSGNPAGLEKPVSQTCTPAQLKDPIFKHWAKLIDGTAERPERLWPKVYILQALKAYGMLEGGARGLGFDATGDIDLPAAMASAGCSIVVIETADGGGQPPQSICEQEIFEQHVEFRTTEDGIIPSGLGQFDFLWSIGHCDGLSSVEEAASFLERSLDSLNLGGIAVHTFTLRVSSGVVQTSWSSGLIVARSVLERIAINLISHGHEVAQIRYDLASLAPPRWRRERTRATAIRDGVEIVPFGLIVRKGNA